MACGVHVLLLWWLYAAAQGHTGRALVRRGCSSSSSIRQGAGAGAAESGAAGQGGSRAAEAIGGNRATVSRQSRPGSSSHGLWCGVAWYGVKLDTNVAAAGGELCALSTPLLHAHAARACRKPHAKRYNSSYGYADALKQGGRAGVMASAKGAAAAAVAGLGQRFGR